MKKITLPVELYSSKNSKQILVNRKTNKPFVAKSKASQKAEKELLQILPLYRNIFLDMIYCKNKPYKIHFKIYRRTLIRFDYVNIIQCLLDCMVKSNWLEDDNANELIPVFEPYEKDAKNPRVEIFIE